MWAPQHAFIFYDSFGKPVAEVDVGFQCFTVGGPFVSDYPDIVALADLVDDLGLPLGVDRDAEAFRKRFKGLQERVRKEPVGRSLPVRPISVGGQEQVN